MQQQQQPQWYSAKCVFRHRASDTRRQMYEERIILLRAESFADAVRQAESEAGRYCKNSGGCEYTGLADVFRLFDEKLAARTEIFSSMRTSDLSAGEYLARFYPEETENCESVGETHRWYNRDERTSACYHCRAARER